MSDIVITQTVNEVTVAAPGPQGPTGATGATGPQGPKGDTGATGVVAATAPVTYDSGTKTVGIDQSGLTLAQSQVTGLDAALAGKSPTTCLYLGASSNYISTPDAAALRLTGDIDLIVRCSADNWASASIQTLVGKWPSSAGQRAYLFRIEGNNKFRLYWSTDGTAVKNAESTTTLGLTNSSVYYVRATLDVDNGGSGYDVKFYTSTDGSTWTQVGSTVTGAGTTSIYAGTNQVNVGDTPGNGEPFIGSMYEATIKNGIGGTIVAKWRGDFPHARSRDAYSNLWTVNGTANGWMVA